MKLPAVIIIIKQATALSTPDQDLNRTREMQKNIASYKIPLVLQKAM
jgi:hypothetical protein